MAFFKKMLSQLEPETRVLDSTRSASGSNCYDDVPDADLVESRTTVTLPLQMGHRQKKAGCPFHRLYQQQKYTLNMLF